MAKNCCAFEILIDNCGGADFGKGTAGGTSKSACNLRKFESFLVLIIRSV
jgi:hypothetical protein